MCDMTQEGVHLQNCVCFVFIVFKLHRDLQRYVARTEATHFHSLCGMTQMFPVLSVFYEIQTVLLGLRKRTGEKEKLIDCIL